MLSKPADCVCVFLLLAHTEDVSASLQGTGPNVKSIVLSIPSRDQVTHRGVQVVLLQWARTRPRKLLNMMQHCSRQTATRADRYEELAQHVKTGTASDVVKYKVKKNCNAVE